MESHTICKESKHPNFGIFFLPWFTVVFFKATTFWQVLEVEFPEYAAGCTYRR